MSVPTAPDKGGSPTPHQSDALRRLLAQGFSRRQAAALIFQRAWWRPRLASECHTGATLNREHRA